MVDLRKSLFYGTTMFVLSGFLTEGFAQTAKISDSASVNHAPEIGTGYIRKDAHNAQKFMIATANPYATDAGYEMLKRGGSAVDAAIAVQLVLTLTEPQSSGIGGGAFMLFYNRQDKQVKAFDGRETAPQDASDKLFQNAEGKPLDFYAGVVGGKSVGVPGVLKMLELAHRQHGKLPWASLFQPAIKLARQGFPVSRRLHLMLKKEKYLQQDPVAKAYFFDAEGNPHPQGFILKNPALANVLEMLAKHGTRDFYQGDIAKHIVEKVQQHPSNPGVLSETDLHQYKAKERPALCTDYRQWVVCGMPPPSSGGIAVAQILGILHHTELAQLRPTKSQNDLYVPTAEAVHFFSEAGRLAFADRNAYVADTDFVALPGGSPQALVNKNYLAQRAALISKTSLKKAQAGQPLTQKIAIANDQSPELPSTSHISIIDQQGNAVSMTTSIEDAFGSRQMVDGFLLNNQLTDFSFASTENGKLIANRVEPNKRPRSSMSPVLVFEKNKKGRLGNIYLVTGSPGGSAIINYTAKTLIGVLDWKLPINDAINMPNFGSRNGPTELEQGLIPTELGDELQQTYGHEVKFIEQTSGIQGIMRMQKQVGKRKKVFYQGAADPRREGTVRGD